MFDLPWWIYDSLLLGSALLFSTLDSLNAQGLANLEAPNAGGQGRRRVKSRCEKHESATLAAMCRVWGLWFLLLTACADLPRELRTELQAYVGRNVRELAAELGYPDGQRPFLGDTLYTWTDNHRAVMTLPTAQSMTGEVGGIPFSATTSGTEDVPLYFHCALTVATDAAGTIKNFSWQGNNCRGFANRLR